jgi:hypothetical protein
VAEHLADAHAPVHLPSTELHAVRSRELQEFAPKHQEWFSLSHGAYF